MAYPTLIEVKDFLGITGTEDDDWLTQVMTWTESLIHEYLGRDLNLQEYTQEYYQIYNTRLHMNNYPVPSLVSVHIDGDLVVDISEYHLEIASGMLHGNFTRAETISVVYNGGYDPIPDVVLDVFYSIIDDRYSEHKGASDADVKDITLFDFGKVSFDTASSGGQSSISYSGVGSVGYVPEPLQGYLGMLNLYKSDTVLLYGGGVT